MKDVALITGASSGIGKELARIHSSKGRDMILVARREKELLDLKSELESKYTTNIKVLAIDLTQPNASQEVFDYVKTLGIKLSYLMNNAGLGGHGYFHERSIELERNMIRLNIQTLVELTHLFLPEMITEKKGKILNTSSTAGYLPGPLQTTYYATKAFVNSFSFGLNQEVKRYGVTVTALCPGPVNSGFEAAAGMEGSGLFKSAATAQSTALKGYKAMEKGKLSVITDLRLKFAFTFLLPFVPKRFVLRSVEKLQTIN